MTISIMQSEGDNEAEKGHPFIVHVQRTISEERICDTLCSAFEGGSNSWYWIEEFIEPSAWLYEDNRFVPLPRNYHYAQEYPLNPGGALLISDTEDTKRPFDRLDRASLEKGLSLLAEKYPAHFRDILEENEDAITGDAFLQCCLFGDIIYC